MKTVVLSLGGSLIVPDSINFSFLERFKKELEKNYSKAKFVIVCGGGSIARKYIDALRKEGKNEIELAAAGIAATRMNARFLMQFFGKEANNSLPADMHEVKNDLAKHSVVICGALRYADNETSDGTAAKLAHFLKAEFINMTNVKGLYTSDPRKDKNAKFIPKISWKDFDKIANKIKFSAGQHFVLDQQAAIVIHEHKIRTYIIDDKSGNISNIVRGKKFIGTDISG